MAAHRGPLAQTRQVGEVDGLGRGLGSDGPKRRDIVAPPLGVVGTGQVRRRGPVADRAVELLPGDVEVTGVPRILGNDVDEAFLGRLSNDERAQFSALVKKMMRD